MCMRLSDELEGAFAALAQAQPLLEAANFSAQLSELHYLLRGSLHFPRGELDACLHEHEQALALALRAGDHFDEARALSGLGDAHYAGGRMKTALGYFDRCMTLCAVHGFGRIEAANRFMVATVRMYMNELEPALDDALQSAELARRVGHQRAEIVSRLTAAWLYLLQGQLAAAQNQTTLGLVVVEQLGAPRFRAFLLESVARIHLARGELQQALATIDEALALARSLKVMRFIGAWLLGTRALILDNVTESRAALIEGLALLDAGCVGHNYYWFYKHAMETSIKQGDRAALDFYAARLEQHMADEPAPWASAFIARARAAGSC